MEKECPNGRSVREGEDGKGTTDWLPVTGMRFQNGEPIVPFLFLRPFLSRAREEEAED